MSPRAMMRHLLNLLAASSLVLCLLTAALWVRSHWHWDSLQRSFLSTDGWSFSGTSFNSSRGRLFMIRHRGVLDAETGAYEYEVLQRRRRQGLDRDGWTWSRHAPPRPQPDAQRPWERLGFRFHVERLSTGAGLDVRVLNVGLPHALIVALTAAPPALWLRRTLRRRRHRRTGECPTCGYDLRASPDRCPECGMTVSSL